jgi:hypothetical protein
MVPQQSRATAQNDHFMGTIIADVVRLKPDTTDERGGPRRPLLLIRLFQQTTICCDSARCPAHQRHEAGRAETLGAGRRTRQT